MDDILGKYVKYREIFDENEQSKFEDIIFKIKKYLMIYDLDFNTNSCQVFEDLYINNLKLHLCTISSKHNLDIKSLYNYRKRFNLLAEKIIIITQFMQK